MTVSFPLVAIAPPGSVEADIGRLQQEVFRRTGCASAVALPPLIPVAFVADETVDVGRLARLCPRGAFFRTGALVWQCGLYLTVDTGGVWEAIRGGFAAASGPFDVMSGFSLGCWEDKGAQSPKLDAPALKFSSCSVTLMTLTVAGDEPWWREVLTEVRSSARIR